MIFFRCMLVSLLALSVTAQAQTCQVRDVGLTFELPADWTQQMPIQDIVLHAWAEDEKDSPGWLGTILGVRSATFEGESTLANAKAAFDHGPIDKMLAWKDLGERKVGKHQALVTKWVARKGGIHYRYYLKKEQRGYEFYFQSDKSKPAIEADVAAFETSLSKAKFGKPWLPSGDLEADRKKYRTHLQSENPAPQEYETDTPPKGAEILTYRSGKLKLPAWVSSDPGDNKRHPAVVFAHGGYGFGAGDWDVCQAYRDAGYIVVVPILRGENGNPGHFEMLFGEVDDVIAAGKAVKKLKYVDPDRIFVTGHSIGGIHAMLAAMMDSPFRAAASFGGTPDQRPRCLPGEDYIPFNRHDSREVSLRSPSQYAASLRCPLQIYYGEEERDDLDDSCTALVEDAKKAGKTCDVTVVPGDHWDALEPAILESLNFFGRYE